MTDGPKSSERKRLLGEQLWDALGAKSDPVLPEGFDAGFRAHLADMEGAEAMGAELWDLLGALETPELPSTLEASPRETQIAMDGRDGLGEALWDALGSVEEARLPDILAGAEHTRHREEAPVDAAVTRPSLDGGAQQKRPQDIELTQALAAGRQLLGESLWELLGAWTQPGQLPEGFDANFRERLNAPAGQIVPLFKRRSVQLGVAVSLLAAAATALIMVQTTSPRIGGGQDDLALAKDLELIESLELTSSEDFHLLMEWDGRVP